MSSLLQIESQMFEGKVLECMCVGMHGVGIHECLIHSELIIVDHWSHGVQVVEMNGVGICECFNVWCLNHGSWSSWVFGGSWRSWTLEFTRLPRYLDFLC